MNETKNGFLKLKEMRKNNKITSKEMANKLGISRAFYCQIENRTRRLSYAMAVKISNIFNTKPDSIFYDDLKSQKNN